ncbi:MAG: VOC family protein [Novosphingobium sp.]|nr:VOC family protein [Novosphingobium sp.]
MGDRTTVQCRSGEKAVSLRGFYQLGYVTRNLEGAIKLLGAGFDLSDFNHFDVDLPLRTPTGSKTASVRVGTAWVGRVQVEVIQPISGFVDSYVASLPAEATDPTPRFHHVAVRRESIEEMERDVAELELPVVFRTGGAGVDSIFVDARSRLGHHLEFVCATPEGWAMLGWPGASS